MLVNVLNMHRNVLAYLVGARGPKLATLTAQHDGAFGNDKLRMDDTVTRTRNAQALSKAEALAEPVDRLRHVFVNEDRDHSCTRCRPVYQHNHLPGFKAPVPSFVTWSSVSIADDESPAQS